MGAPGPATCPGRRPGLLALPLAALLAAGVSLIAAGGEPASARPSFCPAVPGGLSPAGKSAKRRFTMLIRINKLRNVDDYANPDTSTGGLRRRVWPRDIFVVNTRFKGRGPQDWPEIVDALRERFPCNRVIALNGLRGDPRRPGYSGALTGHPGLWGLALDWESGDWSEGRRDVPSIPPWSDDFGLARWRIAKRLTLLGRSSVRGVGGRGRRLGVVPAHYSHWDYGLIARTVHRRNRRLLRRRGFQVVQSQGHCEPRSASDFRSLAGELLLQYRPKRQVVRRRVNGRVRRFAVRPRPRGLWSELAMEISFSNTPDPSDPRPVASLGLGAAARCTRAGLKRGVSAYLYWAHPGSMWSLFRVPVMCRLRPPC